MSQRPSISDAREVGRLSPRARLPAADAAPKCCLAGISLHPPLSEGALGLRPGCWQLSGWQDRRVLSGGAWSMDSALVSWTESRHLIGQG